MGFHINPNSHTSLKYNRNCTKNWAEECIDSVYFIFRQTDVSIERYIQSATSIAFLSLIQIEREKVQGLPPLPVEGKKHAKAK
jgi:hypothetical protein